MAVKLTKTVIDKADIRDNRYAIKDTELKGFECRVKPNGRKTYYLFYRTQSGTQRRPKIGDHGAVTCDEARGIARNWLSDVAKGGDPSRDKQLHRKSPTVAELCDRFLAEHVEVRLKPKSIYENRRLIERHIKLRLGSNKVESVDRSDISKLHHALRETPHQANRVIALISKMFNLAERWGLRPDGTNPCRHIDKFKEKPKERRLSVDEIERLGDVLVECEHLGIETPQSIAAIRLLFHTGCRMSEILTLEWAHVDAKKSIFDLPDSKTGRKVVHFAPAAGELLESIKPVEDNPYVIVGRKRGGHLTDLEKPWQRIRQLAGIEDVRLHDLRHNFASMSAEAGVPEVVLAKMMGHKDVRTTRRYTHISDDPVKDAIAAVGSKLEAALKGKREAEQTP